MQEGRAETVLGAVACFRSIGVGYTAKTSGMGAAGVAPTSRTAAGVYVCNLSQGIPSAVCKTTPFLYAGGVLTVAHTSDTIKTITTSATIGGAAADVGDFDISFEQLVGVS